MADASTCIVNQAVVEAAGDDYGINPAGSTAGPYNFVSWTAGVNVVLTANPYYYGGELAIKDIEFRFITEASTGAISVEAGDIDVYKGPNYIDVVNLQDSDTISIHTQPVNGFDFLGFNTSNAPYDNILVRQAIAYSFDREELIEAVYGDGAATAANGFFPDFVFGYSDNITTYERDPEKAKELLTEAGYEDGLEISIITVDGTRSKVAEYLQDTMKESGFTVNIEMTEWSKFVDDLINGNLGAFIIGVSGDVPDADGILYPQFRSDGGQNVHNYANDEVDEMLLEARQSNDSDERLKLYEDISNILMEELPCIPLYFKNSFALYNSSLKNYTSDYSDDILVEYMSW
jgi:peptide/nickel transport system substrate-binding protein